MPTSRRSPRATSASARRRAWCSSPRSSRSACCNCDCCGARTDMSAVGVRELPGVSVWKRRLARLLTYLGLAVIAIVMLYPFWSMGIASFRSLDQYQLGHGFSLTSWMQLFHTLPVGRQLLSSTIVTVGAIALLLALPAIFTVTVLQFIQIWDDLLVGLLFLQTPNLRPITVGLATIPSQHLLDVPVLMAGSLMSALPAIVVYLVFQRYLITGLTMGMSK